MTISYYSLTSIKGMAPISFLRKMALLAQVAIISFRRRIGADIEVVR